MFTPGQKVKEQAFIEGTVEEQVWGQAVMAAIKGYTSTRYTHKERGTTEAMSSKVAAQRAMEVADLVLAGFKDRRRSKKSLKAKDNN